MHLSQIMSTLIHVFFITCIRQYLLHLRNIVLSLVTSHAHFNFLAMLFRFVWVAAQMDYFFLPFLAINMPQYLLSEHLS